MRSALVISEKIEQEKISKQNMTVVQKQLLKCVGGSSKQIKHIWPELFETLPTG